MVHLSYSFHSNLGRCRPCDTHTASTHKLGTMDTKSHHCRGKPCFAVPYRMFGARPTTSPLPGFIQTALQVISKHNGAHVTLLSRSAQYCCHTFQVLLRQSDPPETPMSTQHRSVPEQLTPPTRLYTTDQPKPFSGDT